MAGSAGTFNIFRHVVLMSGLSCFLSGGPVSEPGAPHPGAGSSEAPRGGEQRDSEDRWQVSETFKI